MALVGERQLMEPLALMGLHVSNATPLTIEETARRVGHYRWLEKRLFELLGGWVGVMAEPAIKARVATFCYNHSSHAELWYGRLPELKEMDPERLTAAPSEAFAKFVDLVEVADPADVAVSDDLATVARLAGYSRVLLPHVIGVYSDHVERCSKVADGPTLRVLRWCLLDDVAEWRELHALVASALTSPEMIETVGRHVVDVEKALVASGGIA